MALKTQGQPPALEHTQHAMPTLPANAAYWRPTGGLLVAYWWPTGGLLAATYTAQVLYTLAATHGPRGCGSPLLHTTPHMQAHCAGCLQRRAVWSSRTEQEERPDVQASTPQGQPLPSPSPPLPSLSLSPPCYLHNTCTEYHI